MLREVTKTIEDQSDCRISASLALRVLNGVMISWSQIYQNEPRSVIHRTE
jgi:hypothetical protein